MLSIVIPYEYLGEPWVTMICGRYWTHQFSPPEIRKDNLELEQKMKNIKLHYYTVFVCGKQGSRSFSKHTYQQQSWQIQMINSLKPCFQRIYIINTFGGGRINNSGVRNRHLWIYSLPDCTEECPAFTVSKLRLNSQLYWSSITEGQRRLIHKSQQIMFKMWQNVETAPTNNDSSWWQGDGHDILCVWRCYQMGV